MSILSDFLQSEAEKKKIPVGQWLENASKNAGKCSWCTHVGKFTNPAVNVVADAACYKPDFGGYLCTENVRCDKDLIATSAEYSPTLKLISLKLEDGKTVFEHFKSNSEAIQEELKAYPIDYDSIRSNILKAKEGTMPENTNTYIRQVYFPVENQGYHLLSVLPSSCLMLELAKRCREMNQFASDSEKEKKSEVYGNEHRRLLDVTQIKIGGSNSQNISFLNNKSAGNVVLLPSFPPELIKRKIVLPKKDFFRALKRKRFEAAFQRLHKNYSRKQNNMEAELNTYAAESSIIDDVLWTVFQLRNYEPGWSNAENVELPSAQKIWLDEEYKESRNSNPQWKEDIADSFARWMLNTYKFFMKQKAIEFNDIEFRSLKARIQKQLM